MARRGEVLRVGQSAATVRVVRSEPTNCTWMPEQRLCMVETTWSKDRGPQYAVVLRGVGPRISYWDEGGRIYGAEWSGLSLRKMLYWKLRDEAEAEFEHRLTAMRQQGEKWNDHITRWHAEHANP